MFHMQLERRKQILKTRQFTKAMDPGVFLSRRV